MGVWQRRRFTLRGEEPIGIPSIGYSFSHIPPDQARSATTSMGATGWHGCIPNLWGLDTNELLTIFNSYREAATVVVPP